MGFLEAAICYTLPLEFFKKPKSSLSQGRPCSFTSQTERERQSFWSLSCFHWFCCCSIAIEMGPVVMTDLCSQVVLADPESLVVTVFLPWTSKLQHSLAHTHLLVCLALLPKHQHSGPTAGPPSFSHTRFPTHWNPMLDPHLSPDLHDEILFECLVCGFC